VLTLLEGAIDDAKVNKVYLQKAENNINRMIKIIEDLQTISQLESGEMDLEVIRFDIVHLVNEVFEFMEQRAAEKEVELIFGNTVLNNKQIHVVADKERIRQVLINLVDNSIKYGNQKGKTRVSFYNMDDNILIEVADDGIGIEANHLSRLFDRFYRVDKSRSRNSGGTGLGLSIVKHIIVSHEQTINVRSMPGMGSTFSFTLKKA
jgi:two-component system, OmpR family, phosphate regulon sensor histidine kinase PhoR